MAAKRGIRVSGTRTSASATVGTVTLRHLATQLADDHELSKKRAEAMLADLVALTTRHLKKGDKARMGRNPATGEAIKIKASKKIAFRPAKELKEQV